MDVKRHENVRVMVINEIKKIVEELLDQKIEISKGNDVRAIILKGLIERSEFLPLIAPQEVQVGEERRFIDMGFSNTIVFEFKSYESEFDEGVEKARKEYLPRIPSAKYYVITNWDRWRIYKVNRQGNSIDLQLIDESDKDRAINELKQIISQLPEFKVIPSPDAISKLFELNANELINKLKGVFNKIKDNNDVKPLYETYSKIIRTLYSNVSEDLVVDLFIKHTIMHMIALASLTAALKKQTNPVDAVSGAALDVDIALPYLNWWRLKYEDERYRQDIDYVINNIVTRAYMIDWELGGAEDIFRALYEVLVEPEMRRRLGEYYTPIWLVELILKEFDLKDKLILDPFCGSGTFLVMAFHKKVNEYREDPDKAINELVGFDINPLAVTIARAELILAYLRYRPNASKLPIPHIYHVDTLGMWFGAPLEHPDPDIKKLLTSINKYLEIILKINEIDRFLKMSVTDTIGALSMIEEHVTMAVKLAVINCKGLKEDCLKREVKNYLINTLKNYINSNLLINAFYNYVNQDSIINNITHLITKYGGNGVWGLLFASFLIPAILEKIKPHIIVTNPPWIPTTEFNATYANKLRDWLSKSLSELGIEKTASIINGSDIATAALGKALGIAQEGVGFVMNREQSFYHRSPIPAGITATYAVLKRRGWFNKLIDINCDAFQHGIYPAVVISKPGNFDSSELYVASVKNCGNKGLHLESVEARLNPVKKTYNEYIRHALIYWKEDLNDLAKALDVYEIIPKGLYIMGIYGGEVRRNVEPYAGIALIKYVNQIGSIELQLHNTSKTIKVPKQLMEQYGVDIYDLIYVGEIYPFYTMHILKILLSNNGEEALKGFLDALLKINTNLPQDDINKIRRLLNEVRQPNTVNALDEKTYYVFYRCDRVFSAVALKPSANMVMDSHVAGIKCKSMEQAYYYMAILNYLAYKVIQLGRSFIHHQFARPALAILIAGLGWNDVPEDLRNKVNQLVQSITQGIVKREFDNQRQALLELFKTNNDFRNLINLLDKYIDKERLDVALDLVSSIPKVKQKKKKAN